jgi:hypothetical protein
MKTKARLYANQDGTATLVALMVLSLLTIMGLSGARAASVKMEIAGNDALNKLAFCSAEASRAYVMLHPNLCGVDNADQFRYSTSYLNWLFYSGRYAGDGSDLPAQSRFY